MKRIILGLLCLLWTVNIFAETELSDSEIIITEFDSGGVLRDMAHPNYSYTGNEILLLFDPNDLYLENAITNISKQYNQVEDITMPPAMTETQENYLFPILISPPSDRIKYGKYTISVRDSNNHILHERSFKIVHPEPQIKKLSVESNFNGSPIEISDTLMITRHQSFSSTKIIIDGENIEQKFEKVFIGEADFELIQNPNIPNEFSFSSYWESEKGLSVSLGKSEISFIRQYSTIPTTKNIYITSQEPKILGDNLEFQVEEGQTRTEITLQVENIFKDANILIKPMYSTPNFPSNIGLKTVTVDEKRGCVTFPILFEPLSGGDAKFKMQVINADGKKSEFQTISIIKKATNIKMSALYPERKPLVAGFDKNIIKFERLKGPHLNTSKNNVFTLTFDNEKPITFKANNITANSITAEIALPAQLPTDKTAFTLRNSEYGEWKGVLESLRKVPRIKRESNFVFKGGKSKVLIENANDVFLRTAVPNDFVKISTPNYHSIREFEIEINPNAKDFEILVMLFDHEIARMSYNVKNYPRPDVIKLTQIVDTNLIRKEKMIVLEADGNRRLQLMIPLDEDTIPAHSKFYAQIFRKNGSPVGNKREFLKDNQSNTLTTTLNTQIGLRPGDEFDILISNPNEDSKAFHSYIKRNFTDKWIITAGLSAFDYRINSKTEKKNDGLNVLDGINFGFYYLPENYANPSNRLIGFGPNLLITSKDDNIKMRFGVSTLFWQKIVLGISYGQEEFGIITGVNIELADFSTLFGR